MAKDPDFSVRWPSGEVSELLPLDKDRFIDRTYRVQVKIERDGSGKTHKARLWSVSR
jgi:hypothetical protein